MLIVWVAVQLRALTSDESQLRKKTLWAENKFKNVDGIASPQSTHYSADHSHSSSRPPCCRPAWPCRSYPGPTPGPACTGSAARSPPAARCSPASSPSVASSLFWNQSVVRGPLNWPISSHETSRLTNHRPGRGARRPVGRDVGRGVEAGSATLGVLVGGLAQGDLTLNDHLELGGAAGGERAAGRPLPLPRAVPEVPLLGQAHPSGVLHQVGEPVHGFCDSYFWNNAVLIHCALGSFLLI